jgi:hypothetical protein
MRARDSRIGWFVILLMRDDGSGSTPRRRGCAQAALLEMRAKLMGATARVAAIACGHEDAIDLDQLRHDPLMKVAVGRCPVTGAPLASQSTISRLENAPSKTEAARLTARIRSP